MDCIRLLVDRIPLSDDTPLLDFCSKHGLEYECALLNRKIARAHLDNRNLPSAIKFYAAAKDMKSLESIAKKILDTFIKDKDIEYLSLLDTLPNHVLYASGDLIAFLAKYRDFYRAIRNHQQKEAANTLLLLMSCQVSPKGMRMVLLRDAVPLLEGKEIFFDAESTFELMRCLEDLVLDQNGVDLTGIEIVKMALVRNLARALLI